MSGSMFIAPPLIRYKIVRKRFPLPNWTKRVADALFFPTWGKRKSNAPADLWIKAVSYLTFNRV